MFASGWSSNNDPRQVVEAKVRGHDCATGAHGGRGDDQIVRATRPPSLADRNKETGVGACDVEVVRDDWKSRDDVVKEGLAGLSPLSGSDLDAHTELGNRDRGDSGLVVIRDQRVEVER